MSNTFNVIGTQDGRINYFGVWEDTEENRQRLLDWKVFGYKETPDEYVVGYDGEFYLKGTEPKYTPTYEEQRQARAEAYRQEKDPITCQINSLRDEEQTPEVIAEIAQLIEERKAKVEEIKQRFPYPEETLTEPSSSNIIETSETDINSILGEKQNG